MSTSNTETSSRNWSFLQEAQKYSSPSSPLLLTLREAERVSGHRMSRLPRNELVCESCGCVLLEGSTQYSNHGVTIDDGFISTRLGRVKIPHAHVVLLIALLEFYPKVCYHEALHHFYENNMTHHRGRDIEMESPRNTISVIFTRMRRLYKPLGLFPTAFVGRGYLLEIDL